MGFASYFADIVDRFTYQLKATETLWTEIYAAIQTPPLAPGVPHPRPRAVDDELLRRKRLIQAKQKLDALFSSARMPLNELQSFRRLASHPDFDRLAAENQKLRSTITALHAKLNSAPGSRPGKKQKRVQQGIGRRFKLGQSATRMGGHGQKR